MVLGWLFKSLIVQSRFSFIYNQDKIILQNTISVVGSLKDTILTPSIIPIDPHCSHPML
jgi:hypothetical protein